MKESRRQAGFGTWWFQRASRVPRLSRVLQRATFRRKSREAFAQRDAPAHPANRRGAVVRRAPCFPLSGISLGMVGSVEQRLRGVAPLYAALRTACLSRGDGMSWLGVGSRAGWFTDPKAARGAQQIAPANWDTASRTPRRVKELAEHSSHGAPYRITDLDAGS